MSLQDLALVLLFFYFNGQLAMMLVFLPIYGAVSYILCSGLTPLHVLAKLQALCVLIMASSKVNQ